MVTWTQCSCNDEKPAPISSKVEECIGAHSFPELIQLVKSRFKFEEFWYDLGHSSHD